jgi:hypothetical protein
MGFLTKRWLKNTPPLVTPEQQEALKSDADAKLDNALALQKSVKEVTVPLRSRIEVNHLAGGFRQAMGGFGQWTP